jgi:hypothetical protein
MHLLMAYRTVLKARRPNVVKSGRYTTEGSGLRSNIRVTLQAYKPNLMPGQHARIGGTVRLMATLTSFKSRRSVFESERPSLIGMAAETSELVGGECSDLLPVDGSVGVMTINAGHSAFR